jgi:hypothetical protein
MWNVIQGKLWGIIKEMNKNSQNFIKFELQVIANERWNLE